MSAEAFDARAALRAWLEDASAFGIDSFGGPVRAPRGGVARARLDPGRRDAAPAPRDASARLAPAPSSAPPAAAAPAPTAAPDLEIPEGLRARPRVAAMGPATAAAPARATLPDPEPGDSLERVAAEIAACTRCRLATTRTKVVPGQGNPKTRILFVGEAPGADEDLSGLAFVGRAGQLLTKMIEAMGFPREEVFIANILKCRPPENRNPAPDEAACCLPFLRRQIALIRPELIIALGGVAVRNLLETESSVGRLRGRKHEYSGVPLVVTFHPSYLLRTPEAKKDAWEDLKFALALLGLRPPARSGTA